MTTDQTVAYVKWAAFALMIVLGIAMALASMPWAAEPTRLFVDLAIWPLDGRESLATPEARLFCAIVGGVLAGWGVMVWQVATRLYAREPRLARTMVLSSIGTWFVVDSTASVLAGAPLNAVLNIGILAPFVVPLMLSNQRIEA